MGGNQWTRYALAGFTTLFLGVPGRSGWFDGIPFSSPHEFITLFVLLAATLFLPFENFRQNGAKGRIYLLSFCIIGISLLKFGLGEFSLPRGLMARYTAEGMEERRLDPKIAFDSKGYSLDNRPLPLWFLNDREKFNQPDLDRTLIPVTAEWNGYVTVNGTRADLVLENDGEASITVNGTPIASFVAWKADIYPLRIEYAAGKNRLKHVRLTDKAGKLLENLYPKPYAAEELARDAIIGRLANLTTASGFFILLLFHVVLLRKTAWKEWLKTPGPWTLGAMLLCFTLLMVRILITAGSPYFNTLYSGSDELTYETFSRHIAITGDWSMKYLEREAYYYQLYYYFLSLMHRIMGEGFFGVFAAQAALLVAAAGLMARRGIAAIANAPGISLGTLAAIALMPDIAKETAHLMPTIMGIFFAACAASFVIWPRRTGKEKGIWEYAAAGSALGLGILNRYNFAAWMPFLILYALLAARKRKITAGSALAIGVILALAPAIIRNGMVMGQWRLVSQSNTTVNFLLGTPVPAGFVPRSTFRAETTPGIRSIFDERASGAIEWIRERPADYARSLARKAKNAILPHIVLWAVFVIVSALWLIRPALLAPGLSRKEYLVWGGFVISQFAAITTFSTGNERYYLPIIPFLIVFAALAGIMIVRSMNSLFHNSKQIRSHIR